MIKFVSQNNNKSLILFVHGFTGGEDTWQQPESASFPTLLLKNDKISEEYDIAHYLYFTKLLNLFAKASNVSKLIKKLLKKSHGKFRKNTSIEEIANVLRTDIRFQLDRYENIVVVAHSMGGLVTKSCIIQDIKDNIPSKIKLFVSLAVPHSGAELATFGSLVSSNLQIEDLKPLNKFIHEINDIWLKTSTRPVTKYFYGINDEVVPKTSACPIDKEVSDIISVDEDHTSITKPVDESETTLIAVREIILKYQSEDPGMSHLELQTLEDSNKYDSELFVLKLIVADIHQSSVREAKEVFLNAEYARKKFNSASDQKRLSDLYKKIKKIYSGAYTKFLHGGIENSGLLLAEINEQILKEDREFLSTLIPFVNAIHKQGMLQQLANADEGNIWWTKEAGPIPLDKELKKLVKNDE